MDPRNVTPSLVQQLLANAMGLLADKIDIPDAIKQGHVKALQQRVTSDGIRSKLGRLQSVSAMFNPKR